MSQQTSSEEKTDLEWFQDILFAVLGLGLTTLTVIGKVARTIATHDYRRGNLPPEGDSDA